MKGMSSIVRNIAGLLGGFVMLYGLYVMATGHLAPGGGFTGGVIIMAGVVMLLLAFGGDRARELLEEQHCHMLEGLGAFAFLAVALLGFFVVGGGFFRNFLPRGKVHDFFSGGTILITNAAIALKVAAGLIGIFLALVLGCRAAMFKKDK